MTAARIWGALDSLVMHSLKVTGNIWVKVAGKNHILLTSYPTSSSLGKPVPLSILPVRGMVPPMEIFTA